MKKTYKIRVYCLNCDYGHAPFDAFEDIELGREVPEKMICPVCSCKTLKKK